MHHDKILVVSKVGSKVVCTQKFDLGQKIVWYDKKVIYKKKFSRGMFYKIAQKTIRTKKDIKNQDEK